MIVLNSLLHIGSINPKDYVTPWVSYLTIIIMYVHSFKTFVFLRERPFKSKRGINFVLKIN